jgi:hypothetical protein
LLEEFLKRLSVMHRSDRDDIAFDAELVRSQAKFGVQ